MLHVSASCDVANDRPTVDAANPNRIRVTSSFGAEDAQATMALYCTFYLEPYTSMRPASQPDLVVRCYNSSTTGALCSQQIKYWPRGRLLPSPPFLHPGFPEKKTIHRAGLVCSDVKRPITQIYIEAAKQGLLSEHSTSCKRALRKGKTHFCASTHLGRICTENANARICVSHTYTYIHTCIHTYIHARSSACVGAKQNMTGAPCSDKCTKSGKDRTERRKRSGPDYSYEYHF